MGGGRGKALGVGGVRLILRMRPNRLTGVKFIRNLLRMRPNRLTGGVKFIRNLLRTGPNTLTGVKFIRNLMDNETKQINCGDVYKEYHGELSRAG